MIIRVYIYFIESSKDVSGKWALTVKIPLLKHKNAIFENTVDKKVYIVLRIQERCDPLNFFIRITV